MGVSFQPDLCLPKDPAGWGRWLTGHQYEHDQIRTLCAALATPANIPQFDIFAWKDEPDFVQQWLVNHQAIHLAIENALNFTGIDFSLVDFSKDEEFLEWQDDHASEHLTIRSILGII